MPAYELVITDVTCYGDRYCVAGWDLERSRMIRPEPIGANAAAEASRFWAAPSVGAGKLFDVGNVVRLAAAKPPANFPFPHATEDRIYVEGNATITGRMAQAQIAQSVAQGVSNSIARSFGGQLQRFNNGKAYVAAGAQVGSLDAIEIDPEAISFHEDSQNGKRRLRAHIVCGGLSYDFSVPADAARTRFLTDGIAALTADAQASDQIHVRLGLSRPFEAMPDCCFAQVNGLYFL